VGFGFVDDVDLVAVDKTKTQLQDTVARDFTGES